jgi:hypothetical protein
MPLYRPVLPGHLTVRDAYDQLVALRQARGDDREFAVQTVFEALLTALAHEALTVVVQTHDGREDRLPTSVWLATTGAYRLIDARDEADRENLYLLDEAALAAWRDQHPLFRNEPQPLPPGAAPPGRLRQRDLNAWYRDEYVKQWIAPQPPIKREEGNAARARFPNQHITDLMLRQMRKRLAPARWKKAGRRPLQ